MAMAARMPRVFRETFAKGNADSHLAWSAVHGKDIADVHHGRLVTKMLQIYICKVEVNTLHQHVCGDKYFSIGIMQYGTIVTNAILGTIILNRKALCEPFYQAKFANF